MATSPLQKFIQDLLSSLGLKRRLANLFQLLASVASSVPMLAKYAPLLQAIASWLGVAGVGHAVLAKTFKLDVHTIGAFFQALLIAAQSVPALAPYAGILQFIATILGALSAGMLLGSH